MLASALGGLSSSTLLNLLVLPALTQRCVRVQSQLQCDEDPLTGSFRPRLCENARAPFSCVNFSHVDAISGDFSHRIRPLAILRGEREVFTQPRPEAAIRLSTAAPVSDGRSANAMP